jgi:hypothetical protein
MSFSDERAVTSRMAIDDDSARRIRHTSSPSTSGIMTSRISRSGRRARACSRAARPSPTVSTWWPSRSRYRRMSWACFGSSSATRIRAVTDAILTQAVNPHGECQIPVKIRSGSGASTIPGHFLTGPS